MDCMTISSSCLPPGFRFHPTDQELIVHYLKKKVSSSQIQFSIISDVDIYKFNPWDLPGMAFFGENEWFFFSPRERKYPNGVRPNRAAGSGYWKATGTDKPIIASSGSCLGVKKALVFYKGRPPKGMKTDWIMYEYRLLNTFPRTQKYQGSMRLDDWVLCRVRHKSNLPLQMGEKTQQSSTYQSINIQTGCNNLYDESDYQVLADLLGSQVQAENSDASKNLYFLDPNRATTISDILEEESTDSQLPSTVQNVLNSIKRTLSLAALDDQTLLPPSKRLYTCDSGDEQSLITSTSFYQPF